MKLTFLGKELSPLDAHELIADNDHGFTVHVSWHEWAMPQPFPRSVTFNNVTEVHHKYDCLVGPKNRIAFESDIHKTGSTFAIHGIESVEIVEATQRKEAF